jgi:hypothetical protein
MPIVKFGDRISGLRSGDVLIRALPPDDEEVVIDLSLVRFANPSGLVSLATACIESIAIGNLIAVVARTTGASRTTSCACAFATCCATRASASREGS